MRSLPSSEPLLLIVGAGILLPILAWGWWANPAWVLLLPILWMSARTRLVAAGVVVSYFAMVNHQWAGTAATFDPSIGLLGGTAIVLVIVVLQATPWILLWSETPTGVQLATRVLLLLVVSLAPPLGIVAGGHPIHGAGAVFAGWGWFGVGATVLILISGAHAGLYMRRRQYLPAGMVLAVLAIGSVASMFIPAPSAPEGWFGVQTKLGSRPPLLDASYQEFDRRMIAAVEEVAFAPRAKVVVAPEGAAQFWTNVSEFDWRRRVDYIHDFRKVSVLTSGDWVSPKVGSQDPDLHFAAILLRPNRDDQVVFQRAPIPYAMWRPGMEGHYQSHWLDSGTLMVDGKAVMVSFCYEDFLPFLYLSSFARGKVDGIVSVSSLWYAPPAAIRVKALHVKSWAQLFGIPLITASNLAREAL